MPEVTCEVCGETVKLNLYEDHACKVCILSKIIFLKILSNINCDVNEGFVIPLP